jgi:hypothetical protein
MVDLVTGLRLAAGALGAVGGVLVFLEFFQVPNYINYEPEFGEYDIDLAPQEVAEYTWFGRAGALLVALAFALQFLATLLA